MLIKINLIPMHFIAADRKSVSISSISSFSSLLLESSSNLITSSLTLFLHTLYVYTLFKMCQVWSIKFDHFCGIMLSKSLCSNTSTSFNLEVIFLCATCTLTEIQNNSEIEMVLVGWMQRTLCPFFSNLVTFVCASSNLYLFFSLFLRV